MNSNIFRAILAMDSYNRGYGSGVYIDGLGVTPVGRNIGTALIIADSTRSLGLVTTSDVGIYASAYRWNGGTMEQSFPIAAPLLRLSKP